MLIGWVWQKLRFRILMNVTTLLTFKESLSCKTLLKPYNIELASKAFKWILMNVTCTVTFMFKSKDSLYLTFIKHHSTHGNNIKIHPPFFLYLYRHIKAGGCNFMYKGKNNIRNSSFSHQVRNSPIWIFSTGRPFKICPNLILAS